MGAWRRLGPLAIGEVVDPIAIAELVIASRILREQAATRIARGYALTLLASATCVELGGVYRRARWLGQTHQPLPRILRA